MDFIRQAQHAHDEHVRQAMHHHNEFMRRTRNVNTTTVNSCSKEFQDKFNENQAYIERIRAEIQANKARMRS